jgi:DNA-binding NarL/FixJ family response regulator
LTQLDPKLYIFAICEICDRLPETRAASSYEPYNRASLSSRQREVLSLAASGLSDKESAAVLGVSVSTVRRHMHLARNRLKAETRVQAVYLASQRNLIERASD